MSALAASSLAAEMAAYIGTAIQAARYLRKPDLSDDDLRLVLIKDGFTASEVFGDQFEAAKKIATG